jgi:pyridinium-3,5-biscarboxylic acid mononucleotide sulfurtransferase
MGGKHMDIDEKFQKLKDNITKLESVAIAYSGGVDSTFLLKVAFDLLGENVIAVTAKSSTYPIRELNAATTFAKKIGAKHIIMTSEELEIEGFAKNPVNRCYFCKKELFGKIKVIANREGLKQVLDGSNFDDIGDFRPGMEAAAELKVISPLKDVGLTKDEIRKLSKDLGLKTWDKPSFACLSSRFPYGTEITKGKLTKIELAEQFLMDIGFRQVRVRYEGNTARIEVSPEERVKFFDVDLLDKVGNKFKEIGFAYSTMDLLGYRTGSMNEVIEKIKK